MAVLKYDKIVRYIVTVQCNGPLRIGSAVGSKEEVLVHPVDNRPFVQASSITGVFRNYYKNLSGAKTDALFGAPEKENSQKDKETKEVKESTWSRIKVSDGTFIEDKESSFKLELRPHVKINRSTGSVDAAEIQGTNKKSGQKFNMEYIGKGSKFQFTLDVYVQNGDGLDKETERILAGLKAGALQFGGKKSSGAGNVVLTELKYKAFDLTSKAGRQEWICAEDNCSYCNYLNELPALSEEAFAYRVIVSGKTEGSIQVKGIAVSDFGKNAPDSQNMQNAIGEYIVPGSSFKGSTRNQMEKIAEYLKKDSVVIDTFGYSGKGEKDSKSGNIVFYDTIIGEKEENDMRLMAHRIRIDKFTGGVFNKGLFSEKNAAGNMEFMIDIKDRNHPDASLGLLILAMRDLAVHMMSVGNGYSTGKGMIAVDEITVEKNGKENKAVLSFKDGQKMEDPDGIIAAALKALKGENDK